MKWNLDISPLFKAAGLKSTGKVLMNENSYDFDPLDVKSSWLYPVFLGFVELKRNGFKPKSFATIGTGSGIDSIGAYEIFHPREIYQTDVHPNVPEVAEHNTKEFIGQEAEIKTFLGDLCQPLIQRNIKVDLVYANIPNIPSDQPQFKGKQGASMYTNRDPKDCPEILQKYCLTLQYLFLKEAKQILNTGGVVVDAIGARVPFGLLEQLYTLNGYRVSELASVYKIQSEPEDVLEGYAKAEKNYGIEFEFYDHKPAQMLWQKLENKNLKTPELKAKLAFHELTATQALKEFKEKGKVPGHICSILSGKI